MKRFVVISVIVLLVGAGCNDSDVVAPETSEWMAMEPIQCLGNAWEQDWLATHGGDPSTYPRDRDAQNEIIKDFYTRQGVEVFRIETEQRYDAVCTACSCPQGHTLYVLVAEDDVEAMEAFGFRRERPPLAWL